MHRLRPGDVEPVLPAYAGMIHAEMRVEREDHRAPRVCGDDPRFELGDDHLVECSPRMRG